MEMNTGMMKADKRAGACNAEAAEPSKWQKERMTQQRRLYRSMLSAASADLVKATPSAARWFCLIVVDGAELSAEGRLVDGGVEVLVPKEKVQKVLKGKGGKQKVVDVERASFTGYVFVRIVPSPEAFQRLKAVKGVLDFLHCGERYHVIPDRHLAFYADKLDVDRMPADKTIGDGSAVHIHTGPFAGYDAIVLQVISPRSRSPEVRVWAKSFAREIKMPLAFLEKL